jgi:ribonuclease III
MSLEESCLPEPQKPIEELEGLLGYTFSDSEHLIRALLHRSYSNERPGIQVDYERLEFLGDAVLDLIVAAWLFDEMPELDEGGLTATRAWLVCEEMLARVGQELALGEHIFLGVGEEASGGRTKPSLLSDTVESIVAAIYIDGGYEKAGGCVRSWLLKLVPDLKVAVANSRDPRSELQEMVQALHQRRPAYTIDSRTGPDHAAVFRAKVSVPDMECQFGEGTSKKEANRAAARKMLVILRASK